LADDDHAVGAWVSRFETEGISAADAANGNRESDGFQTTTAGARGRYGFSPNVQIDGSVRWSKSEANIDGFPAPAYALADTLDTTASEQWSGFARLKLQALGLSHQLSVSASDIDRDTVSSFPSAFQADRQAYRWQADGATLTGALTYAVGAEREETRGSLSDGTSADLGTTSIFGVARYEVPGRVSVTAGLRWDDADDFGSMTTGRLSAAYHLPAGFILSGAYGTGFKAPSISQAVCDFCYSSVPVAVLRPETADSAEVAIGWTSTDGRFGGRATLYRLNVRDQITYFTVPVTFDSYYINIAEARTDGVEVEGQALLGAGIDLTLAWAWTDAINRQTGTRMLRVPEQSGSATLGWTNDRLSGSLTVRAEGDQPDSGGVRKGFVTANLNAAFRLTGTVSLTARFENVTDEHYQQVFGYGEPGRSAYVGVRLRY
jgi:vitamin B12 transporter